VVLFNYAIREITAKIVYYGPGLCGKTTNLQHIHEKLDPGARGKLLSLATDGDRTLFFDFLPIEMGAIGGYKVRFQLYTVPGQVHYNATRKLVLKGVDAVVFVADSQVSMVERNRESFENLIENLVENGHDPARVPVVVQLNKRDLPGVAGVGELVAALGVGEVPVFEAVASRGDGVFETLKAVVRLTLSRLRSQFESESPGSEPREAPPPPPPSPASVLTPAPAAMVASPPPVAPPPAAAETTEGFEEIDLEEFTDEAPAATSIEESALGPEDFDAEPLADPAGGLAAPAAVATEAVAGEADGIDADGEPAGSGGVRESYVTDTGAQEDWRREEAEWISYPQEGGFADEEPPRDEEILREVRQARAENRELRAALRLFLGLIDRQIGALHEGRDLIASHLGDDSTEGSP
jgi:signal recognition particle receptor subunit beta